MPIIPPPNYATLSAMITPAIFLTANGSLIISTSNRMSRIVDRIRVLNDLSDKICRGASDLDFPRERVAHIREELDRMVLRSDLIRFALTMLYLALSAFVGASLLLAFDVWIGNRLAALPTLFALAGVTMLLGASVNLVREALEALRGNRLEVAFYRDLHARRQFEGGGCTSTGEAPGPR
jgi:hypothetical protein